MAALPLTIRHILETEMIEGYKYQSEFARRYYGAGEAAGIEQGRADGLRAAVLLLMRGKLHAVSEHEECGVVRDIRRSARMERIAMVFACAAASSAPSATRSSYVGGVELPVQIRSCWMSRRKGVNGYLASWMRARSHATSAHRSIGACGRLGA